VSSPESGAPVEGAARAGELAGALRAAALFDGAVEPAGALAVLVPARGADGAPSRECRLEIARIARAHGFTHVAIEVAPVIDGHAHSPADH
jgi:hypothetical protein